VLSYNVVTTILLIQLVLQKSRLMSN